MSDRRPANDLPGSQEVPAPEERRQQASSSGTPSLGGPSTSGTSSASLGHEHHEITHMVNKLLGFIATRDDESVARVISTIRSGASHDQILEEIDELSAGSGLANGSTNGTHPDRS
ncbi:hypothetical protein N7486_010370 [Penicillium sp. IBT 16267x]|nr:hypothetical protein N7486_010370 [Penicillium sp. IBT 16267x]